MLKKTMLALCALLSAKQLYAAHPLITDDTGTQGRGKFQIELVSEFSTDEERVDGIGTKETGGEAAAVVSAGLTDNLDLIVALPWQWYAVREDGIAVADDEGLADIAVGLKWRVYDNDESGLSLALTPRISIPTGDETKGLGSGKVSGGIMGILSCESRIGSLHANFGYLRNAYRLEADNLSSRQDIWHASLAAEINFIGELTTVANIGIETNEDRSSNTHPAFILGGLIYGLTDNLDVDLGVKAGLNKAETDTTLMAGMAVRF
jgi:hypothetical protein